MDLVSCYDCTQRDLFEEAGPKCHHDNDSGLGTTSEIGV